MSLTVVNYYSRGYGDSITMMLLGAIPGARKNGVVVHDMPGILKTPEFYRLEADQKNQWLQRLKSKTSIASAHRQYGFDFTTLDPDIVVISIVPDKPDVIARRTLSIDTWDEEHPLLSKYYSKLSDSDKIKYTQKIISQWADTNILDSDIKVPMSNLYYLETIGLGYNKSVIDDIYKNMKAYTC